MKEKTAEHEYIELLHRKIQLQYQEIISLQRRLEEALRTRKELPPAA